MSKPRYPVRGRKEDVVTVGLSFAENIICSIGKFNEVGEISDITG